MKSWKDQLISSPLPYWISTPWIHGLWHLHLGNLWDGGCHKHRLGSLFFFYRFCDLSTSPLKLVCRDPSFVVRSKYLFNAGLQNSLVSSQFLTTTIHELLGQLRYTQIMLLILRLYAVLYFSMLQYFLLQYFLWVMCDILKLIIYPLVILHSQH